MGVDLIMVAEARNADGSWRRIYPARPVLRPGDELPAFLGREAREEWFLGWSHVLFALLGDVNNGRGFERIEPVSPLRGFPDDISAEAVDAFVEEGADRTELEQYPEFAASWLTVAELCAVDWDRPVRCFRFVDSEQLERWRAGKGFLASYSPSRGSRRYELEEWDALSPGKRERLARKASIRMTWSATIRELSDGFAEVALPQLIAAAGEDLESVRIVYYYSV
jgi:hypothetical protein